MWLDFVPHMVGRWSFWIVYVNKHSLFSDLSFRVEPYSLFWGVRLVNRKSTAAPYILHVLPGWEGARSQLAW